MHYISKISQIDELTTNECFYDYCLQYLNISAVEIVILYRNNLTIYYSDNNTLTALYIIAAENFTAWPSYNIHFILYDTL